MVLDSTRIKVAERLTEITAGTAPTDPIALGWGGYANPISIKKSSITDKIPYLKAPSSVNRLQSTKTVQTAQAFAGSVNVRPVDWSLLPLVLCGDTPTTYAIGDTPHYFSVGAQVGEDEFEIFSGGIFKSMSFELTDDSKAAEMSLEMMFMSGSGVGSTDYIGTGSNAADPTGDPFIFDDISGALYDTAADSANGFTLEGFKFGVEYPITGVKQVGNSGSHIGAWGLGQRNISLELDTSLDDLTLSADLMGGEAHTFALALGGKTLTFSNITWEGDWDESFDAEDMLGMPLKASNVDLSIA